MRVCCSHLVTIVSLLVLQFSGFTATLHPIILVPGDGGNQLEAKLDKPTTVHYLCDKKTDDFFNLWLNLELLVPYIIDCWIDNMRLVYNVSSRTTSNSPGVEIRVPGFGNSTVVEYLDPSKLSVGTYFQQIVQESLIPIGYERDSSVLGAPYDFRKAPNELQSWMRDFQNLIETTYKANNETSVVLLCHSMGAPISLYLLQQMSQSWKDKYIKALITLGGVWGGSIKAWKVFAAGDNLGAFVLPSHKMRGAQRTSPSTAWLLPSQYYWGGDEVIVSAAGKGNYTIRDFQKYFADIDFPVGYEMWRDTQNLLQNSGPGVEVHCLHGVGVSTVQKMEYPEEKYFPDKPTLVYGNGDGTVNARSLRGCLNWSADLKTDKTYLTRNRNLTANAASHPPIYHKEFSGVDHMKILTDQGVVDYIKDVMYRMNNNSTGD